MKRILVAALLIIASAGECAWAQKPIAKPDFSKKNTTSSSTSTSSGKNSTTSSSSATSKPETGSLSVQYTPNGAVVYVDGTKKDTTPCEISGLSAGSHTVEISLSGYETATRTVSITANGVREIAGTLTKQAVATGTIAGHDYVDLGLSVKWATCNVGANSPEGYGNYYAWGETSTKSSYDIENCETWEKEIGDIGGTSRDVARVKWGSPWRMPTKAEFEELLDSDNCTWEWTTQGGHKGYKVTSRKNGNSIFLPAAGWRDGTSLYSREGDGDYWSSTPNESYTQYAYQLSFYSSRRGTYWFNRNVGHTVRPVAE